MAHTVNDPVNGSVNGGVTNSNVDDALPEDLDVTAFVGPYTFPDIARRRIAGTLYLIVAAVCAGAWALGATSALLVAAVVLAVIAGYHFLAGWHLRIDQTEALARANRAVGMPVGHASAQLAWRGLRSRPTWRILVYSAESPPRTRGLVELDGIDGEILGSYTEDNPEDWSAHGLSGEAASGVA